MTPAPPFENRPLSATKIYRKHTKTILVPEYPNNQTTEHSMNNVWRAMKTRRDVTMEEDSYKNATPVQKYESPPTPRRYRGQPSRRRRRAPRAPTGWRASGRFSPGGPSPTAAFGAAAASCKGGGGGWCDGLRGFSIAMYHNVPREAAGGV